MSYVAFVSEASGGVKNESTRSFSPTKMKSVNGTILLRYILQRLNIFTVLRFGRCEVFRRACLLPRENVLETVRFIHNNSTIETNKEIIYIGTAPYQYQMDRKYMLYYCIR